MPDKSNIDSNIFNSNDNQIKLLLKELEIVHTHIKRFDDYSFLIKGWAITLWSAITLWVVNEYSSTNYIILLYFPLIIPFLFWLEDGLMKYFQRVSIARSRFIEDYFNKKISKENLKELDFPLFDPVGRISCENEFYKTNYLMITRFWKCLEVRMVSLLYSIILILSLLIIVILTQNFYCLIPATIIGINAIVGFYLSHKHKI